MHYQIHQIEYTCCGECWCPFEYLTELGKIESHFNIALNFIWSVLHNCAIHGDSSASRVCYTVIDGSRHSRLLHLTYQPWSNFLTLNTAIPEYITSPLPEQIWWTVKKKRLNKQTEADVEILVEIGSALLHWSKSGLAKSWLDWLDDT